jgi:hypothetical protein
MIRGESGIWDRWKLFEELLVGGVELVGNQVGPLAPSAVQSLSPSPTFDTSVIAAPEHVRNVPATELRGTCELGFFEQTRLAKTLGDGARCIAHRPIEEASDGLDDQARSHLSPAQHNVADADFAIAQVLAHTMVDSFVPSTQQTEASRGLDCRCQLVSHGLIESPATGTEEQERPRRSGRFDRIEDRLGLHHHAGATTERAVVDRAVNVRCLFPNVVGPQVEQSALLCLPEQALSAEVVDELGEQREDVDA